ncbi:non-ribosomal peptide synthetase [Actinocrispum wychmicini]|uniref:Amino acid adenylation domain-containing protein n=1 Tax=Actinocrispum wychmicini TaxID=1213861 RepID=A0A4R2JL03_9PSEU|nr:non-ribosomal peptide synthetase [Actinocrispum wychmicini]TCO59527.1 amino acid adenylation domain-containing protein [Actinocrispum wychmicini]
MITEIPLSVNQAALWVSWQLNRDAFLNMIVTPFTVRGTVDVTRLQAAVAAVGERFPGLRGVVRQGDGAPVLSWAGQPPLRLGLRHVVEPMERAILTAAKVPLDLENGPPARFELLYSADETVLLVTIAHLVYDGVSLPNMVGTLRAAYRGEPVGAPDDLADIVAFNRRQHELADGPAGAEHREFWRAHLGADAPTMALPVGPDPSDGFQMRTAALPGELVDRVRAVARQLRLTPTVVLYAAYLVLLRRHTGQDDLVVSLPTHGRRGHPGLRDAVGFFSNAVPIRQRLSNKDTYGVVAKRLGGDVRRCVKFADLPQPAILRAAGLPGGTDVVSATIFQYWTSFTRDDVDLFDVTLADGCSLSLLPPHDVAGYRLQTLVREDRDGFVVSWKDTTGELGASTMATLAKDYVATLTDLVTDPARPIGPARQLVAVGRAMLDRLHPDVTGDDPSPHQERMGFVDRFETDVVYDGPPVYHNLPYVRALPSVPSQADITDAFTAVLAAHEVLRTNFVFTEDGFRQRVRPAERTTVTRLEDGLAEWINQPFDLAEDLLIRAAVQPAPNGGATLVLVGHQAVVDHASLRMIADQLLGGTPQPAPEYREWLDHNRGTDRVARDLAALYEKLHEKLAGEIEPIRLPERRQRDAVHVYEEDTVAVDLPAAEEALTLAGFAAVLAWYTGQDELVIGTTQPARETATVGPLSNLVPVRLRTGADVRFADLVAQAQVELDFAGEHAMAPFDDLVRVLDPGKDMSRTALFDVLFSPFDSDTDLRLLGSGAGKYDLHLAVAGTHGRLVFNARYFDRDQFEDFAVHLRRVLDQAADDPGRALGDLAPVTDAEQHRQLVTWNDTDSAYPQVTVTELVRQQAQRTPDAIALTDGDVHVSYRELFASAEEMAHGLLAAGVRPGELVGLHIGRGADQVRTILAVLLAGAGYLPVDPEIPVERKQFILADARVDHVVADDLAMDSVRVLTPAELTGFDETSLPEVSPDSAAYCIYTSGTTGQPKGVVISHRNVVRLLANDRFGFEFGPTDVWTLFHSYHFDFSVWEIFGCLAHGGRLVVVTSDETRDSERFAELLRGERVTVLNQTPGAFAQLTTVAADLPDLRYVIFGGDRLDTARIAGWAATHPGVRLVNMYGITETTVHVTAHTITEDDLAHGRGLVGHPLPTTRVYVLDRHTGRRLLPTGAVGELYVGGAGTAAGYLRRPALTAERFVDSPFQPGEVLFRSGDLGRWWPDGSLEVIGRADSQVKLRGYRIEPGEIESCLRRHPDITQAVVLLDGGSDGHLVAYVETAKPLTDSELRGHLASKLPGYMVPARFHLVTEIPLTSNGKVDRRALSRLAVPTAGGGGGDLVGPTARAVAEIWTDLLGVTDLSGQSSFFDLGGHSLLAAKLLARLSALVGKPLPLRLLFEHPRLQDLADAIDVTASAAAEAPVVVETEDELAASSFQERIFLAERVDPDAHRYVVPLLWRVSGKLDARRLASALAGLVRRHEILRTRFEVHDGRLRQIVGAAWQPIVEEESVTDLDDWLTGRLSKPVDPASGRLLTCALLTVGADQVLALLVHHLAWDLASAPVLLGDLSHYYESDVELPPAGRYRDFVAAQHQFRDSPAAAADLAYWAETLQGAPAYLPFAAPGQAVESGAVRVPLPDDLARRLSDLQTRHGVSWFMAAATALCGVLRRFTGTDDVTIGVTVDNRDSGGDLVGPCLNTVALRSHGSAELTMGELLSDTRERVLEALEHKAIPFEDVVDRLNPPRRPGWTPYADVMLNVNAGNGMTTRLDAHALAPFTVDSQWSYDTKFGVTVTVTEEAGSLGAMLAYRGDRIAAADARQLASLFARLLTILPDVLGTKLSTVDLVTDGELVRLLAMEAGPAAAPPDSVPALFAARVREFPDRPAVVSSTGELTYAQLDAKVSAMAHRLRSVAQLGEHSPVVAVLLGRGEAMVVSELAAWRAGFAYCPIDPGYPAERIRFMLADLAAVAAVTDQAGLADLAAQCDVPVVRPDEVGSATGDEPVVLPDPDAPACLIYTSGTTGQPKGSVWRHRGIAQLARWHVDTMAVTETDRASLLASVGFDGAQWELWPYLVAGACVLPYERPIVVPEVVAWLDRAEITMCFMPTPLAEVLVAGRVQPKTLRWLTMGGTTFTTRLPPDAVYRACNAYGPSENTVVGSVLLIDRDNTLPANDVGRPIQGTSVSLVDPAGQRVPVGVPGEIHLGGVAVANGYWRRPELTARQFLPGPWYRTGDQGRWTADGHLQFLGRIDRQLKIRGYRIEPQEIEVALQADPLVRQALVAGFPGSTPALVGYVVAAGTDRDTAAVAARLSARLPAFMVPDALVWLDELPTSVHGKIEASALPRAGRADLVRRSGGVTSPRTDLERTIAGVWSAVLTLDEIGTEDNFFDLGGNSLLLSTLHARLETALAQPVPIHVLFEFPTIRGLAAHLSAEAPDPVEDPILARAKRTRARRGTR